MAQTLNLDTCSLRTVSLNPEDTAHTTTHREARVPYTSTGDDVIASRFLAMQNVPCPASSIPRPRECSSAFGLPCGAGSKYCATQAQDHERLRGHIVRSLDALDATLGRVILHVMTLGELSPELTLLKSPVRVPIPADHRLLLDEWGTGSRPRIMIARTIQSACQVRH